MTLEEYKSNPCAKSSLPWHKENNFELPDNIAVIHHKDFKGDCKSEAYFRCINNLEDLKSVNIADDYILERINTKDMKEIKMLSHFIETCYEKERLPITQIEDMINSNLFDPSLWIKLSTKDGILVATGISEIDKDVKEGMLEWIQVLPEYQGQGFGKIIVQTTLINFKNKVDFVTVSGKVDHINKPEALYKSCGFKGDDVWHFVSK